PRPLSTPLPYTPLFRSLRFVVLVVALAPFSSSLPAQETAPPSPIPVATPARMTDPETATRAWLDTMPPNEKARSDAYFEGTYWLDRKSTRLHSSHDQRP